MWTNGASVRLLAQPDQLPNIHGASGDFHVEWQNCSLVPQTLAVIALEAYDKNIAKTVFIANALVKLGRRPDKRSAASVARGSVKIGQWAPQNQGNTTVTATAKNHTLQHSPDRELEDDVSVI